MYKAIRATVDTDIQTALDKASEEGFTVFCGMNDDYIILRKPVFYSYPNTGIYPQYESDKIEYPSTTYPYPTNIKVKVVPDASKD